VWAVEMHEHFKQYVESLHPSFERLMRMSPVKMSAIPKQLPDKCVYLFCEGEQTLYVGRTRRLRQRLRQHSIAGAQHNQAVFAFRLAREMTGRLTAAYSAKGSRVALSVDSQFAEAFTQAKARVRSMDVRFVEEADPLRQALLEIYVSIVLGTKYNDFDTH
jgi:predicted GIY-YIG superfamily endonuclease